MEVETKFSNGLLAKMSKITDLISKLEGLEGVSADDKGRVSKSGPQSFSADEVKEKLLQETMWYTHASILEKTPIYPEKQINEHIYIYMYIYISILASI